MTNEQLIEAYYGGDKTAISVLYSQNIGFLKSVAITLLRNGGIGNEPDNADYANDMLDDLVQVGTEMMLNVLNRREYDQNIAKFTTYIYPYIRGVMLEHIRKFYRPADEPLTITVEDAYGFDEVQNPKILIHGTNPEHLLYRKMCIALLEQLFQQLSAKEKQILGNCFGAYGYDKLPLGEISMIEMRSKDAILKNRAKAVEKLRVLYPESPLALWITAYQAVEDALCGK